MEARCSSVAQLKTWRRLKAVHKHARARSQQRMTTGYNKRSKARWLATSTNQPPDSGARSAHTFASQSTSTLLEVSWSWWISVVLCRGSLGRLPLCRRQCCQPAQQMECVDSQHYTV